MNKNIKIQRINASTHRIASRLRTFYNYSMKIMFIEIPGTVLLIARQCTYCSIKKWRILQPSCAGALAKDTMIGVTRASIRSPVDRSASLLRRSDLRRPQYLSILCHYLLTLGGLMVPWKDSLVLLDFWAYYISLVLNGYLFIGLLIKERLN